MTTPRLEQALTLMKRLLVAEPQALGGCLHEEAPQPAFDEEEARGLPAEEVRRRWPRWVGNCPGCGQALILYASPHHYIAGDW